MGNSFIVTLAAAGFTSTFVSLAKAAGLFGDDNPLLVSRMDNDSTTQPDITVQQTHADKIDEFVAAVSVEEYGWSAAPTASHTLFAAIQTAATEMWMDSMVEARRIAGDGGSAQDPVRELGHPDHPLRGEVRLRQLLEQGGDTDADDGSPGGFEFVQIERPGCSSGDEFSSN